MKDLRASLKELGGTLKEMRVSLHIPQRFGEAPEKKRWLILFAYFIYS